MAPDCAELDRVKDSHLVTPPATGRFSILRNVLNLTGYVYSILIFFSAVVLAAQYHFDVTKVAGAYTPRTVGNEVIHKHENSNAIDAKINKKNLDVIPTESSRRHPAAENHNSPSGNLGEVNSIENGLDSGS